MIDNKYYYSIHFDDSVSQEMINDSYSQLLEFAYPTDKTNIYLNDYAKIIIVTMLLLKYVNTLLIQTNNNDLKGAIGHLFILKVKLCCTPLLIMG